MTQAIGILERTSIARGMELGDVMLKARTYSSCSAEPFAPGNSC